MSAGRKASTDAGFRRFMGVHDLNFGLPVCDAHGFKRPGVTHERGQDAVCAGHGVRAVEDLRANHRATQGRCRRSHARLRRPVPRHGLRPDHVARIAARHRGLPGGQPGQAVSYGAEGAAGALDAGRCLEPARLAHLPRTGSATDRACHGAVCPRAFGTGTGRQRLCAGRHHHRSVPELVRMGAVSLDQATWTSSACTRCIRQGLSSSPAPRRAWMPGACTRLPAIATAA